MKTEHITHRGIITEVQANTLKISIVMDSSCSSCHIKSACGVAHEERKMIEIPLPSPDFKAGEEVRVLFNEASGFKALFWGYMFPFILVVLTLFISMKTLHIAEAYSGLISIAMLIPYYLLLYLLRNQMKDSFEFKVSKPLKAL